MKKLIDEKGRLFGLINAVDALVLLLAVALVGAFFLRARQLASAGMSASGEPVEVKVRYQVTVYSAAIGHTQVIRAGDTLYNQDVGGVPVGTIVDVQVSEAVRPSLLLDGTYVMAPLRERYTIVLTVEGEARQNSDDRLYIRNSEVELGMSYMYCTKYSLLTGTITELSCDAV